MQARKSIGYTGNPFIVEEFFAIIFLPVPAESAGLEPLTLTSWGKCLPAIAKEL